MEVKVDSNLIKTEREKRGWSQEHLASVTGLSLRTIQRIEKTGTASFESVTALAAVLELEVADMRATEAAAPRAWTLRLSLELPLRLALAAVSGALCALQFRWFVLLEPGPTLGFGWLDLGIGGTLFGAAVLCPYLKAGERVFMRALGLIGASALSYGVAIFALAAEELPGVSIFAAFLLASLAGVVIVLVAAKFLIPLRVTPVFWMLGMLASLVGGAALYASFELLGDSLLSTVAGYCVWHMLACIALHHGRQPDDAQSGLLADFARTRGRFSIVPGWLRLGLPAVQRLGLNSTVQFSSLQ